MTFNDLLNGVIALIFFVYSPNSITLQADYVTVVEDRLMASVKYRVPVPVFYFWPKLTHLAARLSAIAELLVTSEWLLCPRRISRKALKLLVNFISFYQTSAVAAAGQINYIFTDTFRPCLT